MPDQISEFYKRTWGRLKSVRAWLNPIRLFEVFVQRGKIDYLFFPSNDTHVKWMIPIYEQMPRSKFLVKGYVDDENSVKYLGERRYRFFKNKPRLVQVLAPKVLILGNDWGTEEKKVVGEIRSTKGVSVCIQEGCLDFLDDTQKRMRRADYAFIQGPVMRKYLIRENIVVTGNPKFDEIKKEPLPDEATIMINSNFTYGVFEDVRDQWVKDVVDVCMENGLEFFVSKHPRDKGEFPPTYNVLESGAFLVNAQLRRASVLVSRFSTLIYEALCMGRQAIYYNPHHEPFRIFSEDDTKGIFIAENKAELRKALLEAVRDPQKNEENVTRFLHMHCNLNEGNTGSVERIRDALMKIKERK
jgi:hypothetical protein